VELSVRRRWGAGPVSLLWLHGFAGDGSGIDHLADALGPELSATCPDLPGHGESPLPPRAGGWEATLESLEPLLRGLPRPRLLAGYSQGGRMALALALRAPAELDGLYLESAAPGIADAAARALRAAEDEQLAQLLEREGLEAFLARWEEHPLLAGLRALPAPLASQFAARRRRQAPRGLAAALRALGQGAQPFFPPVGMRRLRVPAAVAAGNRDAKYADLARSLAGDLSASLHLPDCGHAPHLEAPAEIVSVLRALCARLGSAPRREPS
jgi:2-succinyl-6-hydroxy-2,4-cyclohexadiene-1-carboxylate synthase